MAKDTCDPKDRWPQKNECDLKNIRPRRRDAGVVFRTVKAGVDLIRNKRLQLDAVFRAANAGVKTVFRHGAPAEPTTRPAQRVDPDSKNIRARNSGTDVVFRAARESVDPVRGKNLGLATLLRVKEEIRMIFRRGMPIDPAFRPIYHCEVSGEFVLTPLYNEHREYVYNEEGVLVFCTIKVI